MSRPAPHLNPSAREAGFKLPIPQKILFAFGLPVLVVGVWIALFETRQYDVAATAIIVMGGGLLFIYANSRGYRIAWDDERLYMREWGFRNLLFQRQPFHSIAYGDIADMEGKFRTNPAGMSKFMPFEYLEVTSRNSQDKDIWIYPLSIKDRDLAELLVHLFEKRPEIFPKVVLELMRRDGLIGIDAI